MPSHTYLDPNARTYKTEAEALATHKAAKAARATERERARAATKAERAARRATLKAERGEGPTEAVKRLGVGQSVTLTKYRTTGQLSSTLNGLFVRVGQRYTSTVARDLIDGETVIGVTVSRVE